MLLKPVLFFEEEVKSTQADAFHEVLEDFEPKTSAEKQLLFAILCRAFLDLKENHSNIVQIHHRRQAKQWVKSNSMHPWGFRWICDECDLDYMRVRRIMLTRTH